MYYYKIAPLKLRLSPLTYETDKKVEIGSYVNVKIKSKEIVGVITKEVEKPAFKCQKIDEITGYFLPKERVEIANFIATYYMCELSEALELFEPFYTTGSKQVVFKQKSSFKLSSEQLSAFEFCKSRDISLLFGDTGSGKTEIYIRLIEESLREGKNAILLLPEISLTPQIQKRLKAVFGDTVALWHSKQTKKTKTQILESIRSGLIRVIVGPRSALFLPIEKLGIIIVDEEHDDAFKSEQRPRYNARDMAIFIGRKLNAKVVLGSATPSLASYKNIPHFRLKGGFFESKKRFIFVKKTGEIDETLLSHLLKTLSNTGSQAIIFLPTRANFKYVICNNCSKSVECPFCSVSMSLHLGEKQLKCHYCGFSQYIPNNCPTCNDGLLGFHRIGTSEVLSELESRFKDKKFAKFDRDEITTETKLKKTLDAFNNGEIDVLIGTQMLSKGHDYHNVDTAIILGLDSILTQNDFRAKERALSLLVQISGRAGRKKDATVLIQTLNHEFFTKYLNDYELFLKDELEFRQKLYPPFKRLARIIFSDKNRQKAEEKMSQTLMALKRTNIEIVGHGEAAIAKIGGKYRFDILLRSDEAKGLLNAIYSLEVFDFETDIDPLSFT